MDQITLTFWNMNTMKMGYYTTAWFGQWQEYPQAYDAAKENYPRERGWLYCEIGVLFDEEPDPEPYPGCYGIYI